MELYTHNQINRELCGRVCELSEGAAIIQLITTETMQVDKSGLTSFDMVMTKSGGLKISGVETSIGNGNSAKLDHYIKGLVFNKENGKTQALVNLKNPNAVDITLYQFTGKGGSQVDGSGVIGSKNINVFKNPKSDKIRILFTIYLEIFRFIAIINDSA